MIKILIPAAILATLVNCYGQSFNVDGYMTNDDNYTNKTAISFYNGHDPEAYGTASSPIYETYVHWGVGTLSANPTGPTYFFMYVETPIEVKNMVWGNGMTAAEISEYGTSMDFRKATGSEYMSFYDSGGNEEFWSYLEPGKGDSGGYGMIAAKNSADYILENGLGTESSSANHDIAMAFEYQFVLNTTENNALLDILRDDGIIEYHLSPDRGLVPTQVPEPSSTLLIGLSSIAFLLRRKR